VGNINIPFGFVQDGKIFLSGQAGFADREIGVIKNENQEASVQYFEDRYHKLSQEISELESKISTTENKGSYLMKLVHLKKSLKKHNGLGDYMALLQKLILLEDQLKDEIEENQERNTAIKKDLLDDLNEAIKIPDWKVAASKIKDIKKLWTETGNAKESQRYKMEIEFETKYNFFFDRKKVVEQTQRDLNESRASKYESIIDELRSLIRTKDPNARLRMRDLQVKFQEVGPIPRKHYTRYLKEFDQIIATLTNKNKSIPLPPRKKAPKMLTDDEMMKNYEKKLELIRQVTELRQDPSIPKASRLRDIWKAIGPVPRDKSTEISLEFYDGISFVYEVNYLEKVCKELYDNWEELSLKQQTEIKIEKLTELMSVDERELESVMDNKWNLTTSEGSISKQINEKLVIQKRKIRVKTQIMNILLELNQNI